MYGLNDKLAKQFVESEYGILVDVIVKESGVSATTVAAFLTETLISLKREGVQVETSQIQQVKEIFHSVGSGELAKEALSDVFSWLAKNEGKNVHDAAAMLGFKMLSQEELTYLINHVIVRTQVQIDKLGKEAFRLIMGLVMKEARGKANPKVVSALVRERTKTNILISSTSSAF